jgi:hypothetical protein
MKLQATIGKGYELVPLADFSAILSPDQIEGLIEYMCELE